MTGVVAAHLRLVSEAVLRGPVWVWVEEAEPGVCLPAAPLQAGRPQRRSPAYPEEISIKKQYMLFNFCYFSAADIKFSDNIFSLIMPIDTYSKCWYRPAG